MMVPFAHLVSTFVHKVPGAVSGIGNTLVDTTDKSDCRF